MNIPANDINNVMKSPLLMAVMPLIDMLARDDLSWYDRERITVAIRVCMNQYEKMGKEQSAFSNQAASQSYQAYQLGNSLAGQQFAPGPHGLKTESNHRS